MSVILALPHWSAPPICVEPMTCSVRMDGSSPGRVRPVAGGKRSARIPARRAGRYKTRPARAEVPPPMSAPVPALFLDRDGIVNVDHGYVHDPARLDWIEGAREAVAAMTRAGLTVLVVTNQSGIGRGGPLDEERHRR